MTCNLIGSFCGSLCNSCAVSIGNIFNCCSSNKTIYVIGQIEELEANQLMDDTGSILKNVVSRALDHKDKIGRAWSMRTENVKKVQRSRSNAIRSGIIHKASDLFYQLQEKRDHFEGTWKKVNLAAATCQINLEQKYTRVDAITVQECKQLEKGVEKVLKYKQLASLLWRMLSHHDLNLIHAKHAGNLPDKQISYLQKNLPHLIDRIDQSKSFLGLEIDVQQIFLEAAEYFPKEYRVACIMRDPFYLQESPLHAASRELDANSLHRQMKRSEEDEHKSTPSLYLSQGRASLPMASNDEVLARHRKPPSVQNADITLSPNYTMELAHHVPINDETNTNDTNASTISALTGNVSLPVMILPLPPVPIQHGSVGLSALSLAPGYNPSTQMPMIQISNSPLPMAVQHSTNSGDVDLSLRQSTRPLNSPRIQRQHNGGFPATNLQHI